MQTSMVQKYPVIDNYKNFTTCCWLPSAMSHKQGVSKGAFPVQCQPGCVRPGLEASEELGCSNGLMGLGMPLPAWGCSLGSAWM